MKIFTKILPLFMFIFYTFFSLNSFSWEEEFNKNGQGLQKSLFEKHARIKEEFRKSMKLKAEMFDGLEEKLENFMDGVGRKFFDGFFDDDFFKDDFFKDMKPSTRMGGMVSGRWDETDEKMIFVLGVEAKKGVPLNIEIKNGIIQIAGDVVQKNEKIDQQGKKRFSSKRVMRIRQRYSIPSGLDEKNPLIKEEKGKIKIIFKKLKTYRPKKKNPIRKSPKNLIPIDPSSFDKTI